MKGKNFFNTKYGFIVGFVICIVAAFLLWLYINTDAQSNLPAALCTYYRGI